MIPITGRTFMPSGFAETHVAAQFKVTAYVQVT